MTGLKISRLCPAVELTFCVVVFDVNTTVKTENVVYFWCYMISLISFSDLSHTFTHTHTHAHAHIVS